MTKETDDLLIKRASAFQDKPKMFVKISPYWLKQMKLVTKDIDKCGNSRYFLVDGD